MKKQLQVAALAGGLFIAGSAWSEVTFYERDDFRGRSFTVNDSVDNFSRFGFNDRASSAVVRRGSYQVCEHAGFGGRCVTLPPGDYGSLRAMGFNDRISSARSVSVRSSPRAILYSQSNFNGSRIVLEGQDVRNFSQGGFNDRASSLRVERGQWLLCSRSDFRGECRTFGPGEYHHLGELNNRVSSARSLHPSERGDRPGRRERGRD